MPPICMLSHCLRTFVFLSELSCSIYLSKEWSCCHGTNSCSMNSSTCCTAAHAAVAANMFRLLPFTQESTDLLQATDTVQAFMRTAATRTAACYSCCFSHVVHWHEQMIGSVPVARQLCHYSASEQETLRQSRKPFHAKDTAVWHCLL